MYIVIVLYCPCIGIKSVNYVCRWPCTDCVLMFYKIKVITKKHLVYFFTE